MDRTYEELKQLLRTHFTEVNTAMSDRLKRGNRHIMNGTQKDGAFGTHANQ